MSVGLRNSTIDLFRKRHHGNKELRIYEMAADNQSLVLIATATKAYFIGRNSDTQPGAPQWLLTIDLTYTTGLTEIKMLTAAYVDLIDPATLSKRRFRVDTDTTPLVDDYQYVLGLHGAYNDNKAVVSS